jgi:uncharacterized protein (DUF2237 family)
MATRFVAACLLAPAAVVAEVMSIMGGTLDTCSKPGKAMTGFIRDGHCQDVNDDAGSHHICIQMKSDFCTQTGQSDWCNEEMPCMTEDGTESSSDVCPIGNWCVCQWAFARYIQVAGGCDSIVDLACDATNMAAVRAYEAEAANEPDLAEALECIKQKCPGAQIENSTSTNSTDRLFNVDSPALRSAGVGHAQALAVPFLLVALAALVFLVVRRSRSAAASHALLE